MESQAASEELAPLAPTAGDAAARRRWLERFTRWQQREGQRIGVSGFELSGLHCAACAGVIEGALRACPGVVDAEVSAGALRATVHWDPQRTQPEALMQAVLRAGYRAVPDGGAEASHMRRQERRVVLWRLFVSGFLAMQVMMMATPSYVAGPGDLSEDMRRLLNWGGWVLSVPVVAFAGLPFFQGAWRSLRRGRMGMDVPVALALLATFAASSVATFAPEGPFGAEVYFDSLTMFLAFLWGARYVEMRMRHKAAEALESSLASLPEQALKVSEGSGNVIPVPADTLEPGDRVRVVAGGVVPADGALLERPAELEESLLTGESLPVLKLPGQLVLAGSVNVGPPLDLRVERVAADTRHEAIVALMRESLTGRPAAARLADRWAAPFLWSVLLIAAGTALAWVWIDPQRAWWVMVSVLVVTCPCALSLATPATLVAAASGLARRGVLLRRLDALETLARLRHLFLDKTGTVTRDDLLLSRLDLVPGVDREEALRRAAGLAQWSSHPVARALVRAVRGPSEAGESRVTTGRPTPWQDVRETAGSGLSARDEMGRTWRLGASAWAAADGGAGEGGSQVVETSGLHAVSGMGSQAADEASDSDADDDAALVWTALACEGRLVARFGLAEHLRDDALSAMSGLRQLGLQVALLTGDSAQRAGSVARHLGVVGVTAAASPEDKRRAVQTAQALRDGPVGMLGDGLNDAPVMAQADVSLAMGHGALATRQGADAVIVSGSVAGVLDTVVSARRTLRIVRQNLVWSVAYNLLCIPLAVIGWLPPWLAGLGMAGSSLLVVLNAQRASQATSDKRLAELS